MIKIIHPKDNFRGLSYGNWSALWWNWVLSEDPDSEAGNVLFLRGNLNWKSIYRNSYVISTYTPVFFPVSTSCFSVGEKDDVYHSETNDEISIRKTARIHSFGVDEIWAMIDGKPIVDDLHQFLVESPIFDLHISDRSTFRSIVPSIPPAGIYKTVCVGYNILIGSLDTGEYEIRFGGQGRGGYHTDSIYNIKVVEGWIKTHDVSRTKGPDF